MIDIAKHRTCRVVTSEDADFHLTHGKSLEVCVHVTDSI